MKGQQADGFGRLSDVLLVTTRGGGGSKYLGWGYNADAKYTCEGPCEVRIDYFTEWDPAGDNKKYERKARHPVQPEK